MGKMLNLKENFHSKAEFVSFIILKGFQSHRIDKVDKLLARAECAGISSGIQRSKSSDKLFMLVPVPKFHNILQKVF